MHRNIPKHRIVHKQSPQKFSLLVLVLIVCCLTIACRYRDKFDPKNQMYAPFYPKLLVGAEGDKNGFGAILHYTNNPKSIWRLLGVMYRVPFALYCITNTLLFIGIHFIRN